MTVDITLTTKDSRQEVTLKNSRQDIKLKTVDRTVNQEIVDRKILSGYAGQELHQITVDRTGTLKDSRQDRYIKRLQTGQVH